MAIILASKSPRRQELMRLLGLEFTIHTADVDETMDKTLPPEREVARVGGLKAAKIAETAAPEDIVVAADTIVVVDGAVLGKPHDEEEAFHMLKTLSGRGHEVMTGLNVWHEGKLRQEVVRGERRQQQLRASDAGRAAAPDGRGRERLPDGPAGKYLYHSELRRIMAEKKTAAKGYQKFKADLAAGTLGEVYIFCGEESYLREYYLKEVQKKLVPAGFEEFNFHRVAGKGLTMEELTEMTEAMPMMAERTLIVVTDCDLYKLGEEQRTRLIALLDDFPEYCCLIFVYDLVEYKPNKTYKKLYAALSDKAQEVRFEPQDKSDLINWIARRFRATGHDIDARTAEHLMFTCGSLMTGLVPEIEKIGAYAKGRAVTVEDINAVADPVLDAVVFDMTSAVTKGDYDRASELLGQLLKKQEEPIMILGVISKELRRLYTARLALDSGKDKLWLMDLWNMRSDYPARLLLDAARKTTHEWCANSLALCQKLDRRMKSEKGIDREGELKLLLMQLAQRA